MRAAMGHHVIKHNDTQWALVNKSRILSNIQLSTSVSQYVDGLVLNNALKESNFKITIPDVGFP